MGSGSSRDQKVSRHTQVSAGKGRARTPSPPMVTKPVTHSRRPFSSQPSPWTTKTNTTTHRHLSNANLAQYGLIWEQNGKLSSTFQQMIRSGTTKIEHDQKETHTKQLITNHTSTYDSAQVTSTLISEVESTHSLSTPEKLDTLMLNLKQSHVDFDDSIKRRIGQITSETESILAQIVEETQTNQQELLIRAKEQQVIQDEEYRNLLEDFISQLDERRVQQLSVIQEQLQLQRLEIFNQSELKIRALSEQASSIKNQIMVEEERKASEKIDSIVTELNSMSTESALQNLGTEIKTNVNLTVHEKVGSKKSGQVFQFHSNNEQMPHAHRQQPSIKRITVIPNNSSNDKTSERPTSSRLSDHQTKSINKLVKQNPANPKTKSQ